MRLTVVLPGALDHSHLTPGDLDSVRAHCLDTPFSIGQLALCIEKHCCTSR